MKVYKVAVDGREGYFQGWSPRSPYKYVLGQTVVQRDFDSPLFAYASLADAKEFLQMCWNSVRIWA